MGTHIMQFTSVCHHDASGAYIITYHEQLLQLRWQKVRRPECHVRAWNSSANAKSSAADNSLRVYVHINGRRCRKRAIDRLTHISGKKRHFPRQFSLSHSPSGVICIKSDRASRTFFSLSSQREGNKVK